MRKRKRRTSATEGRGLGATTLTAALATLIISPILVVVCNADNPPRCSEVSQEARDRMAIEWAEGQIVDNARANLRQAKIDVINAYLANSPMRGLGSYILVSSERTGVNPFLCCAVATAESSNGVCCCGRFNAWGMLGCSFASWEDGVTRWFDNIILHWGKAQNGYDIERPPAYCETNCQEYAANVTNICNALSQEAQ